MRPSLLWCFGAVCFADLFVWLLACLHGEYVRGVACGVACDVVCGVWCDAVRGAWCAGWFAFAYACVCLLPARY